jgi:hypothetical protein
MLDYQTRFPASLFDQEALEDLVPRLAAMAGVEIEIESVCIVSTNDVGFSGMLDVIAEGKGGKKSEGKPAPKKFKKTIQPRAGKSWRSLPRSWTNEKTKEVISAVELKRRVARGGVQEYEVYINSKGERYVVENTGEGWSLIKEPQA